MKRRREDDPHFFTFSEENEIEEKNRKKDAGHTPAHLRKAIYPMVPPLPLSVRSVSPQELEPPSPPHLITVPLIGNTNLIFGSMFNPLFSALDATLQKNRNIQTTPRKKP